MISLTVNRAAMRAAAPTRQLAMAAAASQSVRYASTKTLTEAVAEVVPAKLEQLKKLKADYSDKSLGEIKLENLIGGMRGLKVMLWEGSVLDANTGITFHGKSIPDCEKVLPTSKDLGLSGKEMREFAGIETRLGDCAVTADSVCSSAAQCPNRCSGSCSLDRSLPWKRSGSSLPSWHPRESCPPTSRRSSTAFPRPSTP